MFGLFKSVVIEDVKLGPLKRSGKVWIGSISLLGKEPVPMELDGDKQAPFPDVIATAIALDGRLAAIQDAFAPALFDHLEPYQDAMRDPDHADEMRDLHDDPHTFDQILAIATPEQALVATDITGVEIGMEGSVVRLLLKMATLWDDEHHVGAYFDDWQFVELNGSV